MNKQLVPLKLITSQISELQLDTLLQTLDRLHEAAASDALEATCNIDAGSVVGWLEDIIYTAQETISELQQGSATGVEPAESSNPQRKVVKLYRQG